MTIYISIGVFLLLISITETVFAKSEYERPKLHLVLYCIITFCAILFVGFRENCGFDYESYGVLFDEFSTDIWFQNATILNVELGYAFLNHILPGYRYVLIIMAIATIYLQFKFLYKFSPLPFLSIFLLLGVAFYPSLMGQYRQAFAVSIICWAFVNRNNRAKFLVLIFLATLFHTSSLLALTVLFLPENLYSLKTYIALLIFALILNLTMKTLFLNLAQFMPAIISSKADTYGEIEDFTLGLNYAMVIRIVLFFLFLYKKDIFMSYQYGVYFINLYFVSLILYLGFGFLPQLAGRGSYYFYFIEFLLVPMMIFKISGIQKWFLFALFVGIAIYRQFVFFIDWYLDYVPYSNIIFNIL